MVSVLRKGEPMYKANLLSVGVVVLLVMSGCKRQAPMGQAPPRPLPKNHYKEAAKMTNAFALSLTKELAKANTGKNIFLSPYSAMTALLMTMAGAKGETQKQMKSALFAPSAGVHKAFSGLRAQLSAHAMRGDFKLTLANRIWSQKNFDVDPSFQTLLKTSYNAPMGRLDFTKESAQAREAINRWVQEKTNKEIKSLISPGTLTSNTRMLLLNAISFKSNWQKEFRVAATQQKPFHVSDKKTIDVPMMTQTNTVRHGRYEGHKMVALPYKHKTLSMLILLPKPKSSTEALIESLTLEKLNTAIRQMHQEKLRIDLPRFKLQATMKLNKSLQAMGLKQAFDKESADFSGMVKGTSKELYLNAVIQKALLEVDEAGTKATVVTKSRVGLKSAGPRLFRADRPFVFILRDNFTGTILFIGQLKQPSS